MAINYDYLIGTKINSLTVLEYYRKNHKTYAKCLCECGNISTPTMRALLIGHSKSCGCLKRRLSKEKMTKHNMCNSRIYKIYHGLHDRCENKNLKSYKYYGAKGIKVCDEWNTFEKFYEWAMKNGYSDDLSIDRIDVNGNYEPDNCRWVTTREQSLNKRNTRYLTYRGITKTLVEWGEESVCGVQAFRGRIQAGWDMKRALKTPMRIKKY